MSASVSVVKGVVAGIAIGSVVTGAVFLGTRTREPAGAVPAASPPAAHASHDLSEMSDEEMANMPRAGGKSSPAAGIIRHGDNLTAKPGAAPSTRVDEMVDMPGMPGMKIRKPPAAPGLTPGAVHLTSEKQQLIGVRTALVAYQTLAKTIRATGKVDFDERRLSHVHTKIEGWIEDLYVNYTGQSVTHGQPLLTIYSPDLVSAQQEYLLTVQTEKQMKQANLLAPGTDLQVAARRRLSLWGMSDGDIRSLERLQQPRRAVTLHAHAGGVVMEKKALAGMRVMPGDDLFLIADLSVVWIYAQVYENELPYVQVGQRADVTLESLPGKTFFGRVVYVYPTLDPVTRTARVRVQLANPGGRFKPEMFASVTIRAPGHRVLAVPSEAVLDSGTRRIAFVARPGGYFEPRTLKTGGNIGDQTVVLSGLKPGERVVSSGNFLIDSESQLQSSMNGMSGHQH